MTKTDTTQALWHARQAADFYWQSTRGHSPHGRTLARKRFIENANLAMQVFGYDDFIRAFGAYNGPVAEAQPLIEQLAAELAVVPKPLPAEADGNMVAAVRKILADALAAVDALGVGAG